MRFTPPEFEIIEPIKTYALMVNGPDGATIVVPDYEVAVFAKGTPFATRPDGFTADGEPFLIRKVFPHNI